MQFQNRVISLLLLLVMGLSLASQASSKDIDESLEDAILIHEIAKAQLEQLEKRLPETEKKKLTPLKARLGELSYKFVKTKSFLAANAKIVMFEYPDIFVFTTISRVTKAVFMLPVMTYLGHPGWGLIWNSLPDVELYDYFYFRIRQKIKRNKMKAQIGFDQAEIELAKQELLKELDSEMPKARLHIIEELGTSLVPIQKSPTLSTKKGNADAGRWVSTQELEKVVGPEWSRELMSLGLDQSLFENAMLQKALSNPEFREQLSKRQAFVNGVLESDMLRFFIESESFMDQVRAQLELNSQPLFSKKMFVDHREYKAKWKKSYRLKTEIGKVIEDIRNYQMTALGQYQAGKGTDLTAVIPWERFAGDKASVLDKLQAYKDVFGTKNPNSNAAACLGFYSH